MSQEALAAQAALHRNYVGLLERGKQIPSILVVEKSAASMSDVPNSIVIRCDVRFAELAEVDVAAEFALRQFDSRFQLAQYPLQLLQFRAFVGALAEARHFRVAELPLERGD